MCLCVCAKRMSIFILEVLQTMWERCLYIQSVAGIDYRTMSPCLKSGDVHVSVSDMRVIWAQLQSVKCSLCA